MKKLCTALAILFFALPFCFAQNFLPRGTYRSPFENGINGTTAAKKSGSIKGRRFLTPTIGYANHLILGSDSANTLLLGADFMYRGNSGFTVWFNNALIAGRADYTHREQVSTPYYPYYEYQNRIRTGFVAGWMGEFLLGYSMRLQKHQFEFGAGFQTAYALGSVTLAEFGALAFRFDYTYFFNEKTGIAACITDGLGFGTIERSNGYINAFSIKAGPVFKL